MYVIFLFQKNIVHRDLKLGNMVLNLRYVQHVYMNGPEVLGDTIEQVLIM